MDPAQVLTSLQLRFPLAAPSFGQRFLPLIERALQAEPEVRERILGLIESSFQRESARKLEECQGLANQDSKLLATVAGVLHGWNPPEWLLNWRGETA